MRSSFRHLNIPIAVFTAAVMCFLIGLPFAVHLRFQANAHPLVSSVLLRAYAQDDDDGAGTNGDSTSATASAPWGHSGGDSGSSCNTSGIQRCTGTGQGGQVCTPACAGHSSGGSNGGNPQCPQGTTGTYPNCVPLAGCTVVNITNNPLAGGYSMVDGGGNGVSRCGTTPTDGTCPANYRLVGNDCVFASCPAGQSTSVDSSGIVECGCPIGYIYESLSKEGSTAGAGAGAGAGGAGAGVGPSGTNNSIVATRSQCVFTQCPSGYTQTTKAQRNAGNGAASNGPTGGYGYSEVTGNPVAIGKGDQQICVLTTPAAPTTCVRRLLCDTDGNLHQRNADCTVDPAPAQPLCSYGCLGQTCKPAPDSNVISFGLSPSLVDAGNATVVSWNVVNVANCTIIGSNMPPDMWSEPTGATNWIGSGVSSPITSQTIFKLHCSVLPEALFGLGPRVRWTDQTATVNIIPTFHEQ